MSEVHRALRCHICKEAAFTRVIYGTRPTYRGLGPDGGMAFTFLTCKGCALHATFLSNAMAHLIDVTVRLIEPPETAEQWWGIFRLSGEEREGRAMALIVETVKA